tara:strand:- start:1907 stop:2200 length:294 start_codon:yes stop_codon:yes gene_type:complete
MSSSFFEIFEKGYVFEAEPPPEIRLYYDSEGKILDTKYVQKNIQEDSKYIIITQEQYDGLNRKLHFVIDNELVYVNKKLRHWYLTQKELARNPYVKD